MKMEEFKGVLSYLKTGPLIQDNGFKISEMDTDINYGLMAVDMRDIGEMIKRMVTVN